ncbi:substrate-binding periplasmic protein [Undibacterium sp. TJN25]|uniref:substrate-binding periplasmic protein n=1 Tax=Undibacterium sp. TJN25 TaxID=3413056 RepID=UPI003BF33CDB
MHKENKIRYSTFTRLVIGASALWAAMAFAAPPKVNMLVGEMKNEQGNPIPLLKEWRRIFNVVEQDIGVEFDIRIYPWPRALANARDGEGLVFGLAKTRERSQVFHFTEPVFASYVWLVTRSDSAFPFSGVADLKGRSVGVVRGVSYGDEFDQQKNKVFRLEEDNASLSSRLQKLARRRMDVMLFSHRESNPDEVAALINRFIADQMNDQSLAPGTSFTVLRKPLQTVDIYFAIKADKDDGIIDKMNVSILRAKRSGDISRILRDTN